MKKFLLAAVAGIAILAGCTPLKGETRTSTVMLSINDTGHGSGVYLGEGLFLTAGHVVGAGKLTGWSIDGVNITHEPIEVVWEDHLKDLALVKMQANPALLPRKLNCSGTKEGQPVFIEGYPFNLGRTLSKGIIAGPSDKDFSAEEGLWKAVRVMDATAAPGISGGPVFNEAGEVVGTLVGGIPGYGFSFMVPAYMSIACELRHQ